MLRCRGVLQCELPLRRTAQRERCTSFLSLGLERSSQSMGSARAGIRDAVRPCEIPVRGGDMKRGRNLSPRAPAIW